MKIIILYIGITGILFICFIVFLTIGLIKKKNALLFLSGFFLLSTMILFFVSVYTTVTKSVQKLAPILEPRNGKIVYVSLFGKPISNCVKIESYQDHALPFFDHDIRLHVKTCPIEMKRILKQKEYSVQFLPTRKTLTNASIQGDTALSPKLMGDSVWMYSTIDKEGNGQRILFNRDSSEVFVRDIFHKRIHINMPYQQFIKVKKK